MSPRDAFIAEQWHTLPSPGVIGLLHKLPEASAHVKQTLVSSAALTLCVLIIETMLRQ